MEYTKQTANKALKLGLINKETYKIILSFIKSRDNYHNAGEIMRKHFENIIEQPLKQAKTPQDFESIKNSLRVMPESADKVFLFRDIILFENSAKKE